MEKNALLNHEVVMASSDKTTNNFISKMKKEGRLVKIATALPADYPFMGVCTCHRNIEKGLRGL